MCYIIFLRLNLYFAIFTLDLCRSGKFSSSHYAFWKTVRFKDQVHEARDIWYHCYCFKWFLLNSQKKKKWKTDFQHELQLLAVDCKFPPFRPNPFSSPLCDFAVMSRSTAEYLRGQCLGPLTLATIQSICHPVLFFTLLGWFMQNVRPFPPTCRISLAVTEFNRRMSRKVSPCHCLM